MYSLGSCRMLGSAITPLLELGGHSHWIWQAKFNPHHDSLLLSASSDALVNLWHTPVTAGESSRGQVGSRGLQGGAGGQSKGFGKEAHDGKACFYDDHEDSVYGKHKSQAAVCGDDWRHIVVCCKSMFAHVTDFIACERMHSNNCDPCQLARSHQKPLSACLPNRAVPEGVAGKTVSAMAPHAVVQPLEQGIVAVFVHC